MTKPSVAAIRAANEVCSHWVEVEQNDAAVVEAIARIIDRETGLSEIIALMGKAFGPESQPLDDSDIRKIRDFLKGL